MVIIGILLLVIIGLLVWYFFIRDSGTDEALVVPLLLGLRPLSRDVWTSLVARQPKESKPRH